MPNRRPNTVGNLVNELPTVPMNTPSSRLAQMIDINIVYPRIHVEGLYLVEPEPEVSVLDIFSSQPK